MEIDRYNRNILPDRDAPVEYKPSHTAKSYPFNRRTPGLKIVPISNILLNTDRIEVTLHQLNTAFNSHRYNISRDKPENINKLNPRLKALYQDFKDNKPLDPIIAREVNVMNDPSPNNLTLPSIVALGAPMPNLFPVSTDYLYKVINGDELVALSVYFKYDHIPVLIRI